MSSTVYRGVLISGGWNGGVPMYTEVSSFKSVEIEEFYCIQRHPHFRVWNRRVPLCIEVYSFHGVKIGVYSLLVRINCP